MFYPWKHISNDQIDSLEGCVDEIKVKRMLFDIFNIGLWPNHKRSIVTNFHLYNYAFCKDNAFDNIRTSTFMSIMTELFLKDTRSNIRSNTMTASFQYFQELVLKHSVERPPLSIKVFQATDVERILNYALDSYYKDFKLYHYIFGTQTRVTLKQTCPNNVEYPTNRILPLDAAFATFIEAATDEPV